MQDFLKEVPALVITLAVLGMATVMFLSGRVAVSDIIALTQVPLTFWFFGGAFKWQPTQAPLQGVSAPPQEKQL
jgi:hypothetical protein